MRPSWTGNSLAFSFTSDPYLPLEADYQLTRQCLEVCLEFRQSVSIVTKSALVRRDKELLRQLAIHADCIRHFSVPFKYPEMSRALKPFTPSPNTRFCEMEELAGIDVEVGIGIALLIPGSNDSDIPDLLKRAQGDEARTAWLMV